jgi:hypothetical protein
MQSDGDADDSARYDCVSYGEKYFIFDQLDLDKADQAISGDVSASWEIVAQLLSLGGDGARDPLHACQIQFWADVSAQNGSLSAAYELALMPEAENAYRCRRSKYWARVVLSRLDEFEQEALRDADSELVQRSLNGRREQMKQSLAKRCPDF